MPLMPARAPLRSGKTINSSMSIVFILEAEVRRSDETKAGIVGGVTQDNHRVISRLPAHGQSFADNRADALPLKLRQHGHGSQSDAAEGGGCVGDCHAREEDMTDHAVVVCGNKRDELSGMRPGEIFALQWKHIADDHVEVVHRIYRGKLDRPKSERSKRTVALSSTTQSLITQWRQQSRSCDPDAWVFPSAKFTTPLGRDNAWRGLIAPRLKTIQLEWATFQIMRRTHASLSRQAGIDPKLVADQLGHGLGVNLDVYTSPPSTNGKTPWRCWSPHWPVAVRIESPQVPRFWRRPSLLPSAQDGRYRLGPLVLL